MILLVIVSWGIVEPKCSTTKFYKTPGLKTLGFLFFIKEEMTTEKEILSFQKKLEERNFVFNDRLLDQLIKGKMERLRRQNEDAERMRRLTKRR